MVQKVALREGEYVELMVCIWCSSNFYSTVTHATNQPMQPATTAKCRNAIANQFCLQLHKHSFDASLVETRDYSNIILTKSIVFVFNYAEEITTNWVSLCRRRSRVKITEKGDE